MLIASFIFVLTLTFVFGYLVGKVTNKIQSGISFKIKGYTLTIEKGSTKKYSVLQVKN